MAAKVFISYSRQDQREAMALSELLRTEGLEVWIDQDAIQTASIWSGEIVDNLKNCDLFMVLLSGHSASSHNVSKELALASENKKTIFPVELENVVLPSPMEYALAGIQRGKWQDKDTIVRGVKRYIAEAENVDSARPAKKTWLRRNLVAVAGALVLITAVLLYAFVFRGREDATVSGKALIATLPFTVLNFDQDSAQNLDVFTDAIMTRLSRSDEFQLVDRARTLTYNSSNLNPVAIGKELHSRFIMDGTVRKIHDRLTVCARLYDTKLNGDIWSKEYSGGMRDILTIKDSVSDDIINIASGVVRAELQVIEAEKRVKDHPNDANACYELGRLYQFSDKVRAASLYKRAIELDSSTYVYYYGLLCEYEFQQDIVKMREVSQRCIPIFEKAIARYPDSIGFRQWYIAAINDGGDHDRAVNLAIELVNELSRWHISANQTSNVYYNAACQLSKNNMRLDLALDYLDSVDIFRIDDRGAGNIFNGNSWRDFAASDPDMDNLRNIPRFKTIMKQR
jgi:TolB-like protein